MIKYRICSAIGYLLMVGIAWVLSSDKRSISWKLVAKGLALQVVLALLLFDTRGGQAVAVRANDAINSLLNASAEGTAFVFGSLADPGKSGFIFFVNVTGNIVFVATLTAGLYHLGVLQLVVSGFAKVMQVVLGTSGAESLVAAVNMFVGQDESALFVRPYLDGMTHSEIMSLMTVGMGTIASGVLVTYTGFLNAAGVPNAGGHLLAASILSAPASLVIAKMIVPELDQPVTAGAVRLHHGERATNFFDALCRGAGDGFRMALNVMAMLIGFVAMIYLVNMGLAWVGHLVHRDITLQGIFGYIFRPFALAMGIPWNETKPIASLLGTRMVLNEFISYQDLCTLLNNKQVSVHSAIIATYALCGFANFSSIAIQIGGIGTLIPNRRSDLARYGTRAMLGGTLSTFLSACLAGCLIA